MNCVPYPEKCHYMKSQPKTTLNATAPSSGHKRVALLLPHVTLPGRSRLVCIREVSPLKGRPLEISI